MVETLAGFQASVRFASTDPVQNRLRFYDDHAQSAIRQLVRRCLAHGYQVREWH